jgi:hypothetical protein
MATQAFADPVIKDHSTRIDRLLESRYFTELRSDKLSNSQ